MATNNNVRFYKVDLLSKYLALEVKDEKALYWVDETQELYLGAKLFGTGALASEQAAGLLSAEDYVALKNLIASGGTANLIAVDKSIVIDAGKIGVKLSDADNNALILEEDGLFVASSGLTPVAGKAIYIADNTIEVKISGNEGNVLQIVEDGLFAAGGGMSAENQEKLDALIALDIENTYATKEELNSTFSWSEI